MSNITDHYQTMNVVLEEQQLYTESTENLWTQLNGGSKSSAVTVAYRLFLLGTKVHLIYVHVFENNKSFPLSSCCFL